MAASIHIHRRRAAWMDRLRAYKIVVDHQEVGKVRNGEDETIEVQPGEHLVLLRVDWCSSRPLAVTVKEGDEVHLRARSRPAWQSLYWITIGAGDYVIFEQA